LCGTTTDIFTFSDQGEAWLSKHTNIQWQVDVKANWKSGYEESFLAMLKPIIEENRHRAAPAF
jgi:hypothetical protein